MICLNKLSYLSFASWTVKSISSSWAEVPMSRQQGLLIWNASLFVTVLRDTSFDWWLRCSWAAHSTSLRPPKAAATTVVRHSRLVDDWLSRQRDKDDGADRRAFMVHSEEKYAEWRGGGRWEKNLYLREFINVSAMVAASLPSSRSLPDPQFFSRKRKFCCFFPWQDST